LEINHEEHATKSFGFLKNKEQELRQSRKPIKKIATFSCNENTVKASYEVSMLIAKAEKPHTIAEEQILPAAKAMVSAMVVEKAAKDLNLVTLSNDTVNKPTDKISDNIKKELIDRICKSQNYSLQVDESTTLQTNVMNCVT
jgi:hypothetical protein